MRTLSSNPPGESRTFRVTGVVRFADGFPAAGIRAAAFDQDLRSEQLLGESRTGSDGAYRIEYTARQFLHRERGAADLTVKAIAEDGTVLAVSPVWFNAPEEAQIDLTIPLERQEPPALFNRIEAAVKPLLGPVKTEELEENRDLHDLTFLAGETGYEKLVLARFVLAYLLAELGITREFWFALAGGNFFEYNETTSLKENRAAFTKILPTLDAPAVRKALVRAFNDREISPAFRGRVEEWIQAFLELTARLVLGDAGPSNFVRQALEHAGIEGAEKQAKFARLFNEHKTLTPELLAALEKDESFKKEEIDDLRTSYQLAEFTRSDFSVVRMLKEEFNLRQPAQIRTLAKLGEGEWTELIERKHKEGVINPPLGLGEAAGAVKLPEAAVYAKSLERQFREAFPTAAFSGGLERALRNGGARGMRHAELTHQIIETHPAFDLLRTSVDDFLNEGVNPELRGAVQEEGFRLELKAAQRVFKLAPTFEATDTLLADGLHSAQMIYRLGESEFVRRYADNPGFTQSNARLVWNRAADTHAAVLTVIGDLKSLDAETLPQVLKNGNDDLKTFPNWENLFQAGDICHCEHCRSVLSPAAYFTDILMFLRDRKAGNPAFTVKDILFQRRPDLGYIELNCENALTPLPYVDVACEVLERVVAAGENDVELLGFGAVPAGPGAKAAVEAALSAQGIETGADFTLSQVDPADPDRWVVHGETATYLLKKKGTPNFFAELLPNTKASSEELKAYPAFVNPKAYLKLRQSRFPFKLPFDLFAEEVRATFQKSNLQRWDLMVTFRGAGAPNNPTDGEIAAEYFGISCDAAAPFDEKRLILAADTTAAGQQAVWGETGNAGWLNTISNVKTFLFKSGLEYEELLALLDLPFINPDGDLFIQHLDPSCDTDKKVILGFDAAHLDHLDRIHRFLRMWRKLAGCKMWELDLAIRCPGLGGGKLDEPFLINLFYFKRLQARLGSKASVESLCGLLDDLNTGTCFTGLHKKRADGLYSNLFLNKKLIQPLDSAFAVAAVDVPGPAVEKISGHRSVILSALGVREADLDRLAGLTRASDGAVYITDDLTLANLSFLWRHAWLAKMLKYKVEEWVTILKLLQQDVPVFANAKAAWEYVEKIGFLKATGFTPDELDWILAADRTAKAAVKESDAARFLASLRTELQAIQAEYKPEKYEFLNPPSDEERLSALLITLLQQLHRDEKAAQFFLGVLRNEAAVEITVAGLPGGFDFPAAIKNAFPIRYDESSQTLRYTGWMTAAHRNTLLNDPSLAAVTGIAAYQEAIEAFFQIPRLAVKFMDPVFAAPLPHLPAVVDFATLPDPALILKIAYDAEARELRFTGIMTLAEKNLLDGLSADPAYRNAVNSLYTQPAAGAFPPEKIWLLEGDLQFPLRDLNDPSQDHLKDNLATAVKKGLAYLSRALSEGLVIRQAGAALGLTEGLTRRLLMEYAILPATLLEHLTQTFPATSGVVDHATLTITFDGWYWANRVAALWSKWNLILAEWKSLNDLTAAAQLLDFTALPLDDTQAMAPIDRVLRTDRLLRFRQTVPESKITLLELLAKLNNGEYATPDLLAADVALMNEAWSAAGVEALINAIDPAYPNDYLLAENWERIRRAFYFMENLNAGADTVNAYAAATMGDAQARELKTLLRSKLGSETWLALCGEIQDALRERKRDALTAYLLTQPKPADAPTGKWENTNDLYAYYLLDVEMCPCQLTSRLVQASGSVQLFVQRCFMGLEPFVKVQADGDDGDSAWRWWKWMRKYRVWEANRKVFLWPENWIEPELKKDRSPYFKELENELLQNEINQHTVEAAFTKYLEKLDQVAQLEVAGFYQEDDGDNTILHVFGRTKGAEPHVYYYRRFDYRQWTPWEKVDLDIQSDYLVPAVINQRLYLFWPLFTEVPDESANNTVSTPSANQSNVPLKKAWKLLRLKMAMSSYRQGQWTPMKISKHYYETASYDVEIVRKHYRFFPIDRTGVDGRFGIHVEGSSLGRDGNPRASLSGAFEITGCQGTPEPSGYLGNFKPILKPEWESAGNYTTYMKWAELGQLDEFGFAQSRHDTPQNDFTLENQSSSQSNGLWLTTLLHETPWFYRMSPLWHLSYLDRLLQDGLMVLSQGKTHELPLPIGSWLPFFYNDKKRTFFVLPLLAPYRREESGNGGGGRRYYYPDIKREFRKWEDFFQGLIQTWVDQFNLGSLSAAQRQHLEQMLYNQIAGETVPPFPGAEVKRRLVIFFMRGVHAFLAGVSLWLFQFRRFHFFNDYHPFVCEFAKRVQNPVQGIPGLMKRETQLINSGFNFANSYNPTVWVVDPSIEDPTLPDWAVMPGHPKEVVDFSPSGAYSSYNWEIFYHIPLFIANVLSQNQRFEEAREWYHFIFNPIGVESSVPGGSAMSKYWITKPFFETTDPMYIQQRIENILRLLAGDTSVPGYSPQTQKALEDQVYDWRVNPFEPHRIANYRTVAYQKTVVMKYLDNLIAWGDSLFRQDSMESINEATQLYILAAELLGPRPMRIPPQAQPPVESFNELEKQLDAFANALVEVENLIPMPAGTGGDGMATVSLPMLYFCIPHNEKMLSYWDTVADRLYKIRHCMNIEGVVRQLALFEPPIDPGALVKAVAAGLDISSALADLNAPLPLYRFHVLLQKANEVCNDVKALGAALLSALEKKDAEALSRLRQDQEIRVLDAAKAVREQQIAEAEETLAGLQKSREMAQAKKVYYESREFMNAGEIAALTLNSLSTLIEAGVALGYVLSGGLKAVPQFLIGASGFGGSPHATAETGGKTFGSIAEDAALTLTSIARALDKGASIASTVASYQRRQDDWDYQKELAKIEIEQLDKSIAAAELRVAIAEKELENQKLQIDNAKAMDAFMRSKYTSQELYQWQIGQISGVYFQSYKLAYDLAKRAERCFRFELGLADSRIIMFGYWDNLKKGLLSGEKLQYDLRRLETAYLEQNRREFELTKPVSLLLLDPLALVRLRETGRCFFHLPEEIFDLDFPGHYFRRIKSVSLTLPCVAGPYTSVACTLRLLKNSIRMNATNGDNGYPRNTDDAGRPADDSRFVESNIPVKAVATSSGQNDSGVFELSFRDERYLPFEGAGVISEWALELFSDLPANNPDPANPDFGRPMRQFDYSTITDAILHIRYTAREDAGVFKNGAITHLREYFSADETTPSWLALDLRREYGTPWSRFLHPTNPAQGNVLEFDLPLDRFPIRDAGKTLKINTVFLLARCTDAGNYGVTLTPPLPVPPPAGSNTMTLAKSNTYGGLHFAQKNVGAADLEIVPYAPPLAWRIKVTRPGGGNLIEDPVKKVMEMEDLLLILGYEWE